MPTPNDYEHYRFEPNTNVAGGDASPTADAAPAPQVPAGVYPNAAGYGFEDANKQFSSDKQGDPARLADATESSMSDFADLQQFLMTNLETAGSRIAHPVEKAKTPGPATPWKPQAGAEGESI